MSDQERDEMGEPVESEEPGAGEAEQGDDGARLSASARRERLAQLASALGDRASAETDKVVVDTRDPVALDIQVERDGAYRLTWWLTATHPSGHPRWREAVSGMLRPGEAVHTSALGGGYLVEIERQAATQHEAVALSRERGPLERVREIVAAFPDAIAKLPPEPVPDYLLPERDGRGEAR